MSVVSRLVGLVKHIVMSGSWLGVNWSNNHVSFVVHQVNNAYSFGDKGVPVAGEGKPPFTNAFPTLACITFANAPLAKMPHVTKPRLRR